MKGEFTIPQEIITAIAEEVASILKPMMNRFDAPKQTDGLIGVAELSKYLGGVSKDWIYQRTAKNEIPFIKIGHLIKFRQSDIDRWLSTHASPAVAPLSRNMPNRRRVPVENPSQDMQSHGGERKKCL